MAANKQQWQQVLPGALAHAEEVHVWCASLDLSAHQRENLLHTLSADEVARAGRFFFRKDQDRFIAARGILRNILGHYLGEAPRSIRFAYSPHGKPVLEANSGGDSLCFNLSHSDRFALYAVALNRNMGVDIEHIRYDVAVEQITRRFFSPGEASLLGGIPEKERYEVFFQYWTRKESVLKAKGEGLSFPMEQCDVSCIHGELSAVTLPGKNGEASCWYVQDLFPGKGYAAAIAVEGGDCKLSCFLYNLPKFP
ncbi:4'-phosphopantetheinyl transferase [Pontibacter diazotrophicus]|uniref:4'-phosphopantetheinyl transferase n=1 Tax=Pontibacter diazotrophicus TaxID=1400979 RepID=A0A3D8LDJ0_9BACT|nr:4'-phosphopantetheinyl transferase superfamily protein [Pontibacter diazotrophicus]RDV15366.1 4'-phosphopantetheinyl transferase [Pontibacter diazotrophicus]